MWNLFYFLEIVTDEYNYPEETISSFKNFFTISSIILTLFFALLIFLYIRIYILRNKFEEKEKEIEKINNNLLKLNNENLIQKEKISNLEKLNNIYLNNSNHNKE